MNVLGNYRIGRICLHFIAMARARLCLILLASALIGPAMAQVVVSDPWVRGTVESQISTSAYMTLQSTRDLTLIGASSEVAGRISIHEMRMHGDMMMMRPVERLPVRSGHPVALDGEHYHLMLDKLKRPLKAGDTVALDLRFLEGNGVRHSVHAIARVRGLATHDSTDMHMQSGVRHE